MSNLVGTGMIFEGEHKNLYKDWVIGTFVKHGDPHGFRFLAPNEPARGRGTLVGFRTDFHAGRFGFSVLFRSHDRQLFLPLRLGYPALRFQRAFGVDDILLGQLGSGPRFCAFDLL